MDEIILEAALREETGRAKANDLRDKGFIPAVIYSEGKESYAIKVSHKELLGLLHQHHLENAIINLKIKDDKKKKSRSCLIKDIQYHPVKSNIIHVDFNEISLTKAIKVNVPVAVKGEPAGVKQEGGSLEHILWEIEIECLPTDIPKNIELDVSALKIGDSIHIKEVAFPANVKVLNDPDSIIVSVKAPMKEEVAVEAEEGAEKAEPEVIKEKKEVPAEGKEGQEKEKEKEK
jgi:large subunit ribosomal protein L25